MSLECSHDPQLLAKQELEAFLSHLYKRLHEVQWSLFLLPPDAQCQDELIVLLRRWSCELELLEESIISPSRRNGFWHSKRMGLPEEVRCANPACMQTFWKWRPADPQRFCSPACVRQGRSLVEQLSKPAGTPQGAGRRNPGVAAANRRRWAQQREQRAHEYALRLLAEAGLIPAEQETYAQDGS